MNPTAPAAISVSTIASHMFMPTSVAITPMNRPDVPVITPADRSNSPPIMSRATATATMPRVEAGSSQFATPEGLRNTSDSSAKNTKTMTTPISAPSSGLSSSRRTTPTPATRSSTARSPTTVVTGQHFLSYGRGRGTGAPPAAGSAGAGLRQVGDLGRVVLGHEARAGQHRPAAADGVEVGLVLGEQHDRQVALLVLLLVDREVDLPAGDRGDHVGVEVEGGQLGAGAGVRDGGHRHRRDARVQRQHAVDRLVRLQLGLDRRLGGLQVGPVDLEVLHLAERLLGAGAALLEPDVAGLVDDAEQLGHALALQPLAGALPGDAFVLPHVGDRSEQDRLVLAGVDGDHRD